MLPGLVHDNPRDGSVSGAVTLAHLYLDLSNLLTSAHLLHLTLIRTHWRLMTSDCVAWLCATEAGLTITGLL